MRSVVAIVVVAGAVVLAAATPGAQVQTGVFGATMQVASVNDGPFTVIVDL